MDLVKAQLLVEELNKLNEKVASIDRILASNYYPESVVLSFDFEDLDEEMIKETIAVNAEIYRDALKKQKEYTLNKFNSVKKKLKELVE